MQNVIELGRVIRDRKTKPLKQPLRRLTVVHPDPGVLAALEGELAEYIYQEVNVREMATCSDPEKFGTLCAEPVFAVSQDALTLL
jgi:isoleucyl-tRNA synthetase